MQGFKRAAIGAFLLACAPALHASNELLLAPGKSVTLVDAANPWLRVVLTAPDDAPLDVGALLEEKGVSAIATAAQAKRAARLVQHEDGSISIAAASIPHPAANLHGGVLVLDAGRFSLHPETVLAAQPRASEVAIARNGPAEPPLPALLTSPLRPAVAPVIAVPAAASIGTLNVGPGVLNTGSTSLTGGTINFGSISVSGGSISAGSIPAGGGSIQITSPNGVTLQSGGSISVGGTSVAPTGIGTTGGSITVR